MDLRPILNNVGHRPYPKPGAPYVMQQAWYDLLFAHWTLAPGPLRKLLPPQLDLDLFEGRAYVGLVPFGMDSIRLRGLPSFPGTDRFLELNVRTYVRSGGRAGVYFFSLDAGSRVAVRVARFWFGLPYFDARMSAHSKNPGAGNQHIHYQSERIHRGAAPARLDMEYGPVGRQFFAQPGSLEHWLTERYCLYVVRRGRVVRGEIHHDPWPLYAAQAEFHTNSMLAAAGLNPDQGPPILHFVPRIEVAIWTPVRTQTTRPVLVPVAEQGAGG